MGGRGTYAAGNNVDTLWETVETIHGVEILKGTGTIHRLPEESHSINARYILLNPNNTFRAMRVYDQDHYLKYEFGYHGEKNLNHGNRKDPVLHYHVYDRNFERTDAVRIHKGTALYRKLKPYLRGVKL